MNAFKRLMTVSFCFLTACAPPKQMEEAPINKVIPVQQRTTQTIQVTSWEIDGAIAAKNKSKGWSATLNWMQNGPNSYQIRLVGPLGSGSLLISKNGSMITVHDGKNVTQSKNGEALLLQQTGIRLPVNNLYYWVKGMAAPGKIQSEVRDQYNHLIKLQQNGYLIEFNQYTSVKGIDLPSKIHLVGNGVSIKVIIKNWRISK